MAIDTWVVLAKHILDCKEHTNSRNAAKPRNQPFQGEKVKKNGPKWLKPWSAFKILTGPTYIGKSWLVA